MKCKICGAELRKEGDICTKCYEKLKKEEMLENDTNIIYELNSRFVPGYEIAKIFEYLLLGFIAIVAVIAAGEVISSIIAIVIYILAIVLYMRHRIKKCKNGKCTFYETKVVCKTDGKEKVLEYENLKDIGYYQSFGQKIFDLGDLRIFISNGKFLNSNITFENVKNIKEEYEKLAVAVKKQLDME